MRTNARANNDWKRGLTVNTPEKYNPAPRGKLPTKNKNPDALKNFSLE